MIRVESTVVYDCDTKAEMDKVVAKLPPDSEPQIDAIFHRVTVKLTQQVETI